MNYKKRLYPIETLYMRFVDIIGGSTCYWVKGDSFLKGYGYDIEEEHWTRIKNTAIVLSDKSIGPNVKSIDDDSYIIEYEKITPFNAHNKDIKPNMSNKEIRCEIRSLVDKLHSLGYGHGDLHLGNIGFANDKIYILDPDSIYRIEEGPVEWLASWMKEGFDWEGSFSDFVQNDYTTWLTDWVAF
jgi:hypothetical protein